MLLPRLLAFPLLILRVRWVVLPRTPERASLNTRGANIAGSYAQTPDSARVSFQDGHGNGRPHLDSAPSLGSWADN